MSYLCKKKNTTMVYFIQENLTGAVKIGFTDNIKRRLTKMQADNSNRLIVIRTIDPATRVEERKLQYYFDYLHITGEWYLFDEQMLTLDVAMLNITNVKKSAGKLTRRKKEYELKFLDVINQISVDKDVFITMKYLSHCLSLSKFKSSKYSSDIIRDRMNQINISNFGTDSRQEFNNYYKFSKYFYPGVKWAEVCSNVGVAKGSYYRVRRFLSKNYERYQKINEEKLDLA